MTKDEIEKMEAGREMDALIAENIMGWKRDWYWVNSATKSEEREGLFGPEGIREVNNFPHYSTDISAAWEVVEKMNSNKMEVLLDNIGNIWSAEFFSPENIMDSCEMNGDTAPLAICRSALWASSIHEEMK